MIKRLMTDNKRGGRPIDIIADCIIYVLATVGLLTILTVIKALVQ